MVKVTSHGAELHVDDLYGDRRPIVLVHGWPLSGEAWKHQVEAFSDAGHRVVTYDRRGFGRSGVAADGAYDYDALTDDLEEVVRALDLSDAVVVGFSMGGGEAVRLATRASGRLAGIVLAAAVPPYLLKTEDNPDGPLPPEGADGMKAGLAEDREGFLPGFVRDFFRAGDDVAVSEAEVEAALGLALQSDQDAALACIDSFSRTDFRDDVAAVRLPTLVVHGDADGIVPLEGSGQRAHDAIEGSKLVVIKGGPHGVNVSHADEFNRAVLEFVNSL
ncbi:alpha/beta fold hydrolase [Nocardioides daphniae]|nr:alpha/beta hydrolase [Nocardioides daphniae]QCC78613.1 alpha/beta hydrolase [Nocardioides daphniae]